MSSQDVRRPLSRRMPLGEATRRVNNEHQQQDRHVSKGASLPRHASSRLDALLQLHITTPGTPLPPGAWCSPQDLNRSGSPNTNAANPRLSAISKDHVDSSSNRNSQVSTCSTNASDGKKIKACIGPWKLGKTLGKGSTARVRLARHAYSGQEAAIKIVQKKNAQLSQAGSLAALDQAESHMPDAEDGVRKMPVGIEREVAIMKLIQHPNIMKLYDIWENRTEIYLVLEYVDNGELFEHITVKGKLEEEEAVKFFRQILSAVGYCHSFKICHRDLKPENILLTKAYEIKIADFGMAALHQSPDHKLKTSCGSPHYAAPELIRGAAYRGDKVDIWSMGVILYAALAGRLPFDVNGCGKEWLGPLLSKIRKGAYEMDPDFSPEASNLIWRILQVNPKDRINLNQIWNHPLIRKYDHLDDLGGGAYPLSPKVKDAGRPVLRKSDINKAILRHLRSLWHRLSEQQLMDALLSEEPNEQKLFYKLLLKYRDAQLENYTPDLEYSSSDYHHVKPFTLTKAYSTCDFPSKGHGRQVSRFTVISNVAETEQSYDPFRASRPQHLSTMRPVDRAKITIHRTRPSMQNDPDVDRRISYAASMNRDGQKNLAPPRPFASHSSLASSTRSRNSARQRPTTGYKRGVSFSHIGRQSLSSHNISPNRSSHPMIRHSSHTEVTDDGGDVLRAVNRVPASTQYIRSKKEQAGATPLLAVPKASRASQLWNDDVRQLSSSLAKDCDEAFNRSSIVSESEIRDKPQQAEVDLTSYKTNRFKKNTPTLPPRGPSTAPQAKHPLLSSRPLPPAPARTASLKIELLEARKQAELRKASGGDESPGYLDRMVLHIDRLIQPSSPIYSRPDRRALSAPVENNKHGAFRQLPSIHESHNEELSPRRRTDSSHLTDRVRHTDSKTARIASAPEARSTYKREPNDRVHKRGIDPKGTIRVVQPSSPTSPVRAPAPLVIRKKSSMPSATADYSKQGTHRQSGLGLRQQYQAHSKYDISPDLDRIEEDDFGNDSNSGTIIKKKSTWFKRNSKAEDDDDFETIKGTSRQSSQSSGNDTVHPLFEAPHSMQPPKKKGFSLGKIFRKRSKPDMSVPTNDIYDDDASDADSVVGMRRPSQGGRFARVNPVPRQIEPQRSWLAKLFNVKPVSVFICFSVSKKRSRIEIVNVLRDWKRYGIREVQVDKARNIVFGKVGAKNYLELKEVAFACEIMTVIEHGRRSHLSIARLTQERGAASSFHKVVETLETVLKCRGLLVSDERKKRMMIKTLQSA